MDRHVHAQESPVDSNVHHVDYSIQTDRHKENHYRRICHKNDRMYMYMVNLLKSHDNLHGITFRIEIMLNGIAIIKHWIVR